MAGDYCEHGCYWDCDHRKRRPDAGRPIAGMRNIRYLRPPLRPRERDYVASLYDEEISYTDLHVGRFLDALEERGVMERALVVFVSDHGEELWEHGGFEHGHVFYQELLHVPLVFWAPPVRPLRIEAPVSQVDVLPTVLDALGLPAPDELDGVSLWPALTGGAVPQNREIVAHNSLRGPERQTLVAWPWKLIAYLGNEPPRLFDLEADPGEQTDLSEEQPERTAEMLERLRRKLPATTTSARGRAVQLDEELRLELEALGYLEDGDGS